jgi:ABC-type molybdenum transport system ATPase subunit/photorepair protein PhrA
LVKKQEGEFSIEIKKSCFTWGIKQANEEEEKDKKKIKKDKKDKKVADERSTKITLDSLAVLKDFELKVKKGEFVCIIGDVGSGKSTILSTIIGDLIPINENQYNLLKDSCKDGSLDEKTAEKIMSGLISEINEKP